MNHYIMEVAGKDSVAAALSFAADHREAHIVPTIVLTGTEYGDMASYENSISFLKGRLEEYGITIANTVYLQDGALWNLLNARYQYPIYRKYQFYTPCIMCHLYAHLLRVNLYRECGAKGLITGERSSHAGKLKANQHEHTVRVFRKILQGVGMEPICPLMDIRDTKTVDALIGDPEVIRHANDVKCVFSSNLQGFPLEEPGNVALLDDFLEGYVLPVGEFCAGSLAQSSRIEMDKLENLIRRLLS